MAEFHLWATYLIIGLSIIAYVSERWSLETVALASLSAFLALFAMFPFSGSNGSAVTVEDLLQGFANPALATVLALLIVGQGLFATDALDHPARVIGRLGGLSSRRTIAITLIAAALLSAVLNNTPVVVIFIPVLTVLAAQRNFPVTKALLPLSYLSILGGMTTLIGSSTNLLVAGVAAESGLLIGFFDITVPGLILAAVGSVYVLFVMPALFRDRRPATDPAERRDGSQYIGDIEITAGHPFEGLESRAGLFLGLEDLMPRLVQRRGLVFRPPFEDVILSEGDVLVVTATRRSFMRALARGSANLAPMDDENENANVDVDIQPAPGPDYQVAEAVIAPASRHAGRTIRNAGIETQNGVHVIGVRRKNRMGRLAMLDVRLEPGDTILVGGTEQALQNLRQSHDLLLLEWSAEPVPQTGKAWIAFLIFAGIVTTAATGLIPIAAASIVGAFGMVAAGCLTLPQAARAFDRQVFILVGASIAAAVALERTGGAELIADTAVSAMDGQSSAVMLSGLFAVIAIMTNLISNNATAVLFTPIAIGIADATGVSREAFVAVVIFAANASFATPVGYQTNLLVMGPGRYTFADFVKAGLPLVIIMWLTFTIMAPWYYGL